MEMIKYDIPSKIGQIEEFPNKYEKNIIIEGVNTEGGSFYSFDI